MVCQLTLLAIGLYMLLARQFAYIQRSIQRCLSVATREQTPEFMQHVRNVVNRVVTFRHRI